MSKKETVTRTVTVELPKKANDLLEDFAKLAGETVETIFREHLLSVLSNFYNGDHFSYWMEEATKLAKEIEKQFDC